jgi:hypothetical protein
VVVSKRWRRFRKLVNDSLSLSLARKAELRFYVGLMVQLRSMGPGLWADRWLFEQTPELRAELMVANSEGLTSTYNRFLDPPETSSGIL